VVYGPKIKFTQMTKKSRFLFVALVLGLGWPMCGFNAVAQTAASNSSRLNFCTENIFPSQNFHVHSSSVVELPNGDLLACWFEGSGERKANDVKVKGARLKKGDSEWTKAFLLADTPGHPDCNPVLFIDKDYRLHLFWIVVQANRWETSILKSRVSSNYQNNGPPVWEWQDVILLKPGKEFVEAIKKGFLESTTQGLAWAEYAPQYERMIVEAAMDPKKRETGWMTRTHPIQLQDGRILLPLYSDGYNLSLIAISDDYGKSWQPSLPIVGRGNVQPSLVQKKNGNLVAFMRDNGDWVMVYNDIENGRYSMAVSLSEDEGETWRWTRHLEKMGPGEGSFSYPSVIQTKDGIIHVTYSYSVSDHKTIKHVAFSEEWVKENEDED